jgi:hypothetical protein
MENSKPWYLSKTIWGVIITGVGLILKNTVIPDVSSDIIQIIGLIMALIGRVKAKNLIA